MPQRPKITVGHSLVIVAALCLCGTSASAARLTMQECTAKYKAALAAGKVGGKSWVAFQEKQCGITQAPRRPKSSK